MTNHAIGIDISKSRPDAFRLGEGAAKPFGHTSRGFRALIRWLGKARVACIVFEPTGPHHRAFEAALSGKFPLVKVNPLQARRFAEACGAQAKTDAADARILARMGAALALEPDVPVSPDLQVLEKLQVARRALATGRTRLRNRGHVQIHALVKRQIAELDAGLARLAAEDGAMARAREILCSIPGIGPVATALIPAFLPEIGRFDSKQAASLAGLAPFSRESGQWTGRSFISGGRKPLRDALCRPALLAMRFNPDLKVKHAQLREAGTPAKVAIVALMRKLMLTANALVKADRLWTPKATCA
ncbi:transposase [Mangrovicoccus ximenensis]|uniref:transposase n=1 Tax=Mangrovicoccus ximenensis TaxID=1911570 RepID=UPI000D3AB26A|nr:transposase [Mangrovicoccus ximenensis]